MPAALTRFSDWFVHWFSPHLCGIIFLNNNERKINMTDSNWHSQLLVDDLNQRSDRNSSLEKIANSAQAQAEYSRQQAEAAKSMAIIAKYEAESAKRDALFSKIVAILSLIISIAAVFVTALA